MPVKPEVYLLLDTNVLAGYYAPQTLSDRYSTAADRIKILVDSVKKGCSPHIRLLTPEVCVAETQTVLSKHAHTGWTKKRKKDNKQAIHGKSYATLKKMMRADLHGGCHIESIPLQRYHVLARHLVTPVDHNYHQRGKKADSHRPSLGGMDQLIAGVGVWLNRFLGEGRVVVISTDCRLVEVLTRCRKLKEAQAKKYGLIEYAEETGIDWHPGTYPEALHLDEVTDSKLATALGAWPLPLKVAAKRGERKKITPKDLDELVGLYRALKVGRDRLPYTKQMTKLTRDFNRSTGHQFDEAGVWEQLLRQLKQGHGTKARAS